MRRLIFPLAAIALAVFASFILTPRDDVYLRVYCGLFVLLATGFGYLFGRKRQSPAGSQPAPSFPGSTPVPFWRFSIREMLLIVPIVFLVLALGVRSRPYATSSLFKSLAQQDPFKAVLDKRGIKREFSGDTEFHRSSGATFTGDQTLDIQRKDLEKLVSEIQRDLEDRIQKAGGNTFSSGGNSDKFMLNYMIGGAFGSVSVASVALDDKHSQFFLFISETGRDGAENPGSFGSSTTGL